MTVMTDEKKYKQIKTNNTNKLEVNKLGVTFLG